MALPQFEAMRKKAAQQIEAEGMDQDDAIKRRFAAMGGLNSGAYIKQQQLKGDAMAKRKDQAMQDIGFAEQAEEQRRQEIAEGRQFQSGEAEKQRMFARGERIGSQDFSSGESAIQRRFLTGERVGSQDFQSGEAQKQRGFLTSERMGSQQHDYDQLLRGQKFQGDQASLQRAFMTSERMGSQQHDYDQLLRQQGFQKSLADIQQAQFDKQFALDEKAQNYNINTAEEQKAKDKQGFIKNLGEDVFGEGGPSAPEKAGVAVTFPFLAPLLAFWD